MQLIHDLQSSGAQLLPHRQPAELLQTHGSGYKQKTKKLDIYTRPSTHFLLLSQDRWQQVKQGILDVSFPSNIFHLRDLKAFPDLMD